MTLEQAQAEYIEFLERHIAEKTTICVVHGIYDSEADIETGKRMRELIADLQDEKKPPTIA